MKKILAVTLIILSVVLVGCGDEKNSALEAEKISASKEVAVAKKIDVDLTKLSATMLYSEVFNIMQTPADFRGKTIKIRGKHMVSHDPQKNVYHHACVIYDATACCMQGMEFELVDGNYPPNDSEITLIGRFDTYTIQKIDNPILRDAQVSE